MCDSLNLFVIQWFTLCSRHFRDKQQFKLEATKIRSDAELAQQRQTYAMEQWKIQLDKIAAGELQGGIPSNWGNTGGTPSNMDGMPSQDDARSQVSVLTSAIQWDTAVRGTVAEPQITPNMSHPVQNLAHQIQQDIPLDQAQQWSNCSETVPSEGDHAHWNGATEVVYHENFQESAEDQVAEWNGGPEITQNTGDPDSCYQANYGDNTIYTDEYWSAAENIEQNSQYTDENNEQHQNQVAPEQQPHQQQQTHEMRQHLHHQQQRPQQFQMQPKEQKLQQQQQQHKLQHNLQPQEQNQHQHQQDELQESYHQLQIQDIQQHPGISSPQDYQPHLIQVSQYESADGSVKTFNKKDKGKSRWKKFGKDKKENVNPKTKRMKLGKAKHEQSPNGNAISKSLQNSSTDEGNPENQLRQYYMQNKKAVQKRNIFRHHESILEESIYLSQEELDEMLQKEAPIPDEQVNGDISANDDNVNSNNNNNSDVNSNNNNNSDNVDEATNGEAEMQNNDEDSVEGNNTSTQIAGSSENIAQSQAVGSSNANIGLASNPNPVVNTGTISKEESITTSELGTSAITVSNPEIVVYQATVPNLSVSNPTAVCNPGTVSSPSAVYNPGTVSKPTSISNSDVAFDPTSVSILSTVTSQVEVTNSTVVSNSKSVSNLGTSSNETMASLSAKVSNTGTVSSTATISNPTTVSNSTEVSNPATVSNSTTVCYPATVSDPTTVSIPTTDSNSAAVSNLATVSSSATITSQIASSGVVSDSATPAVSSETVLSNSAISSNLITVSNPPTISNPNLAINPTESVSSQHQEQNPKPESAISMTSSSKPESAKTSSSKPESNPHKHLLIEQGSQYTTEDFTDGPGEQEIHGDTAVTPLHKPPPLPPRSDVLTTRRSSTTMDNTPDTEAQNPSPSRSRTQSASPTRPIRRKHLTKGKTLDEPIYSNPDKKKLQERSISLPRQSSVGPPPQKPPRRKSKFQILLTGDKSKTDSSVSSSKPTVPQRLQAMIRRKRKAPPVPKKPKDLLSEHEPGESQSIESIPETTQSESQYNGSQETAEDGTVPIEQHETFVPAPTDGIYPYSDYTAATQSVYEYDGQQSNGQWTDPNIANQQWTDSNVANQQWTDSNVATEQWTDPSVANEQWTDPNGAAQQRMDSNVSTGQWADPNVENGQWADPNVKNGQWTDQNVTSEQCADPNVFTGQYQDSNAATQQWTGPNLVTDPNFASQQVTEANIEHTPGDSSSQVSSKDVHLTFPDADVSDVPVFQSENTTNQPEQQEKPAPQQPTSKPQAFPATTEALNKHVSEVEVHHAGTDQTHEMQTATPQNVTDVRVTHQEHPSEVLDDTTDGQYAQLAQNKTQPDNQVTKTDVPCQAAQDGTIPQKIKRQFTGYFTMNPVISVSATTLDQIQGYPSGSGEGMADASNKLLCKQEAKEPDPVAPQLESTQETAANDSTINTTQTTSGDVMDDQISMPSQRVIICPCNESNIPADKTETSGQEVADKVQQVRAVVDSPLLGKHEAEIDHVQSLEERISQLQEPVPKKHPLVRHEEALKLLEGTEPLKATEPQAPATTQGAEQSQESIKLQQVLEPQEEPKPQKETKTQEETNSQETGKPHKEETTQDISINTGSDVTSTPNVVGGGQKDKHNSGEKLQDQPATVLAKASEMIRIVISNENNDDHSHRKLEESKSCPTHMYTIDTIDGNASASDAEIRNTVEAWLTKIPDEPNAGNLETDTNTESQMDSQSNITEKVDEFVNEVIESVVKDSATNYELAKLTNTHPSSKDVPDGTVKSLIESGLDHESAQGKMGDAEKNELNSGSIDQESGVSHAVHLNSDLHQNDSLAKDVIDSYSTLSVEDHETKTVIAKNCDFERQWKAFLEKVVAEPSSKDQSTIVFWFRRPSKVQMKNVSLQTDSRTPRGSLKQTKRDSTSMENVELTAHAHEATEIKIIATSEMVSTRNTQEPEIVPVDVTKESIALIDVPQENVSAIEVSEEPVAAMDIPKENASAIDMQRKNTTVIDVSEENVATAIVPKENMTRDKSTAQVPLSPPPPPPPPPPPLQTLPVQDSLTKNSPSTVDAIKADKANLLDQLKIELQKKQEADEKFMNASRVHYAKFEHVKYELLATVPKQEAVSEPGNEGSRDARETELLLQNPDLKSKKETQSQSQYVSTVLVSDSVISPDMTMNRNDHQGALVPTENSATQEHLTTNAESDPTNDLFPEMDEVSHLDRLNGTDISVFAQSRPVAWHSTYSIDNQLSDHEATKEKNAVEEVPQDTLGSKVNPAYGMVPSSLSSIPLPNLQPDKDDISFEEPKTVKTNINESPTVNDQYQERKQHEYITANNQYWEPEKTHPAYSEDQPSTNENQVKQSTTLGVSHESQEETRVRLQPNTLAEDHVSSNVATHPVVHDHSMRSISPRTTHDPQEKYERNLQPKNQVCDQMSPNSGMQPVGYDQTERPPRLEYDSQERYENNLQPKNHVEDQMSSHVTTKPVGYAPVGWGTYSKKFNSITQENDKPGNLPASHERTKIGEGVTLQERDTPHENKTDKRESLERMEEHNSSKRSSVDSKGCKDTKEERVSVQHDEPVDANTLPKKKNLYTKKSNKSLKSSDKKKLRKKVSIDLSDRRTSIQYIQVQERPDEEIWLEGQSIEFIVPDKVPVDISDDHDDEDDDDDGEDGQEDADDADDEAMQKTVVKDKLMSANPPIFSTDDGYDSRDDLSSPTAYQTDQQKYPKGANENHVGHLQKYPTGNHAGLTKIDSVEKPNDQPLSQEGYHSPEVHSTDLSLQSSRYNTLEKQLTEDSTLPLPGRSTVVAHEEHKTDAEKYADEHVYQSIEDVRGGTLKSSSNKYDSNWNQLQMTTVGSECTVQYKDPLHIYDEVPTESDTEYDEKYGNHKTSISKSIIFHDETSSDEDLSHRNRHTQEVTMSFDGDTTLPRSRHTRKPRNVSESSSSHSGQAVMDFDSDSDVTKHVRKHRSASKTSLDAVSFQSSASGSYVINPFYDPGTPYASLPHSSKHSSLQRSSGVTSQRSPSDTYLQHIAVRSDPPFPIIRSSGPPPPVPPHQSPVYGRAPRPPRRTDSGSSHHSRSSTSSAVRQFQPIHHAHGHF